MDFVNKFEITIFYWLQEYTAQGKNTAIYIVMILMKIQNLLSFFFTRHHFHYHFLYH